MEIQNKKFIVRFQDNLYDLSNFALKHPGGVNTLSGLENLDVTSRFMKAPPHSSAALYLMNEYKLKGEPKFLGEDIKENSTLSNGHSKVTNVYTENNDMPTLTDDSMEHIVDWSKAMLPQIHKISEHYNDWVNKPVDRPLRLFESWYLEVCSKTPWWVIPTFWIPAILQLIYLEAYIDGVLKKQVSTIAFYFIAGFMLWTLVEYCLHRWVFHIKITPKNTWLCTFHFMMHGLHHKVPFDPYRLVFPPVPAVIIASIFYVLLLYPFLLCPKIILAGGLSGYVCYDLMHYYLHYGSPSLWHLYQMKRYHYQHHFVRHDSGFGISSPLWDFVLNTRIYLRHLKYMLKWK